MPWRQSPSKVTTPAAKANARKLRRSLTDAEKQLWNHLRGNSAGADTHFRRQVAIGSYVADFCCLRHRLIVELDGPVHETASGKSYDKSREKALREYGYRILRFSNVETALDLSWVLERMAIELTISTPTPGPSPQGGGEGCHA